MISVSPMMVTDGEERVKSVGCAGDRLLFPLRPSVVLVDSSAHAAARGENAVKPWLAMTGVILFAATCPVTAQDESKLDAELDRISTHRARGDWRLARSALNSLLHGHARSDGALSKRIEIAALSRDIDFHLAFPTPSFAAVIEGELRSHDLRSGRLSIRYEAGGDRRDFTTYHGPEGKGLAHPLRFDGPYEAEIRWPRGLGSEILDVPLARVAVGVAGDDDWLVSVSRLSRRPAMASVKVARRRGIESVIVAEAETRARTANRGFRVIVAVERHRIRVSAGGRDLATAPKPDGRWGGVAIEGRFPPRLNLRGDSRGAWLAARRDSHLEDRRREFERNYELTRHLPAWLLAPRLADPRRSGNSSIKDFPGPPEAMRNPEVVRALATIEARRHEETLSHLDRIDDAAMSGEVRAWLRGVSLAELGRDAEAQREFRELVKREPTFLEGRVRYAETRFVTGERRAAVDDLSKLIEDHPFQSEIYAALSPLLAELDGPAPAEEMMARAITRGLDSLDIRGWMRLFVRARLGPSWPRRHEVVTRHYRVRSDISRQACADAAGGPRRSLRDLRGARRKNGGLRGRSSIR